MLLLFALSFERPVCHLHVHRERSERAADVPGGPVVRIGRSDRRGPGYVPGQRRHLFRDLISGMKSKTVSFTRWLYDSYSRTLHCTPFTATKTPTEEAASITRKAPVGPDCPRNGRGPVGRSSRSVESLPANILFIKKPHLPHGRCGHFSEDVRGVVGGGAVWGCQVSRSLIRE